MTWTLRIDDVAPHVDVAPGASVTLRGQWYDSAHATTIDACQSGGSAGVGLRAQGWVDWSAGGWHLESRDFASHTCTLVATGDTGVGCAAAGVASPCLPSRMRSIAAQIPESVDDLRSALRGGIEVSEPHAAGVVASGGPTASRGAGRVAGGAGIALAAAIVGAWVLRARRAHRRRPEVQIRLQAARIERRLASARPVLARVAPNVRALAQQAQELAAIERRIQSKLRASDRAAIERRRVLLATDPGSSDAEVRDLLDRQVARLDRLDAERARVSQRLRRVHESLRCLEDGIADGSDGPDREAESVLLREIERDVQLAQDAEQEADRVVAGG